MNHTSMNDAWIHCSSTGLSITSPRQLTWEVRFAFMMYDEEQDGCLGFGMDPFSTAVRSSQTLKVISFQHKKAIDILKT